ncbi:MAG: PAS domain S-box protein, partial [Ignavibacteriaceae bacterium]
FEIISGAKLGINIRQHETIRKTKSGTLINVSLTISPIKNEEGVIIASSVIARDITRRKKNQQEIIKAFENEKKTLAIAEEQQLRVKFLAEASNLLNTSLNYEETLSQLGSLVTPKLADWFAVDLFDENNNLARLSVSHEKFLRYKIVEKFMSPIPPSKRDHSGVYKAIKERKPILYSEITDKDLNENSINEEQFKLLKKINIHSAMIIPLVIRDKVLGVLIFVNAESKLNYNKNDLIFAEDLAVRAALAIDNAMLYKKEHSLNKKLDLQLTELKNEIKNRKFAEKTLKESEKKLVKSEDRFGLVLEATKVGPWYCNLPFNKLEWSNTTKMHFGLPLDKDVTIDLFYELIHPDDREMVKNAIEDSLKSHEIYDMDYRVIHENGDVKWIKAIGKCFYDSSNKPKRFDGITIDVTEKKKDEEEKAMLAVEVNRQRERINNLVANVPGVVWESWGEPDSKNQQMNFISSYVEKMIGYSVEDWLSKPNFWVSIIHPDDKSNAIKKSRETYNSGKKGINEFRWIKKDGSVIWVETQSTPILDEDNKPIGMRGVTMDITERVRNEGKVKHFGKILENSLNEIYIFDSQTLHFTQVNHGARKNLGYTMEELKYLTPLDLKADFTSEEFNKLISPLRTGEKEIIIFTTRHQRKDKTFYDVEVYLQFSRLENPHVFVATIQDITERKQAEQKIQASLNEKEVLLREVHHRVKNNLQIISSLLNLQATYIDDKTTREYFYESQNRIKSMALIHEKLYRPKDISKINFTEYLQELISNLSATYSVENQKIKFNTKIEDVSMNMDIAINLGLIINELISNALKYAFPNGKEGYISISLIEESNVLKLSVIDNGIGLPEELNIIEINSLGLQLVNAFTEQLGGIFKLTGKNGTKAEMSFPKPF